MSKFKSSQSEIKKSVEASQVRSKSASGSADYYAVEVIGLLGIGALVYATFAIILV